MTTFQQTVARVDGLSAAVGRLCSYMESLKVKEVAAAAGERTHELEERLTRGAASGLAAARDEHAALAARVDELEVALQKEQ
eukprot:7064719-Prymnesium_polylepis.1